MSEKVVIIEIIGTLNSITDHIDQAKMIPTKKCMIQLSHTPDMNSHINTCDFIIGEVKNVKELVKDFANNYNALQEQYNLLNKKYHRDLAKTRNEIHRLRRQHRETLQAPPPLISPIQSFPTKIDPKENNKSKHTKQIQVHQEKENNEETVIQNFFKSDQNVKH